MARTAWNQPRAKRSANRKAVAAKRTFTAPRSKSSAYSSLSMSGTNPQGMLIHRGVGFPNRFRTKLQFTESIVLTSFGTTITQFYGVRLNGPYDPVLSIGGGQPTYYDQFAAIYNTGTVVGSKMTVTFALPNSTTVGDGPYHIGILSTGGSTLPSTDSPTLATSPECVSTVLQTGGDTKKLTTTFSQKMISVADQNDANNSFGTGTTPPFAWNGLIWASPQGTSTAGSVNAILVVEYIVDFYGLKPVVDL